jgi:hypothetical protein
MGCGAAHCVILLYELYEEHQTGKGSQLLINVSAVSDARRRGEMKASRDFRARPIVPNENSVRPASDAIPQAKRKALADRGPV